jgi:hypothetical protein
MRLHQLDAVAERIGHVDAIEAVEWLVVVHGEAVDGDGDHQGALVVDDDGGVRLGRRPEVRIDTRGGRSDLRPRTSSRHAPGGAPVSERADAEHLLLEHDRVGFAVGRHRQLHMIQTEYCHGARSGSVSHRL